MYDKIPKPYSLKSISSGDFKDPDFNIQVAKLVSDIK